MPTGFKLLGKLAFVRQCVTYSISLSSEAEDVASLKDEHKRGRGSMQARLEAASAQDIIWWCEMWETVHLICKQLCPMTLAQCGRLADCNCCVYAGSACTSCVHACECMNVQCIRRHACIQACIRRFVCMLAFK